MLLLSKKKCSIDTKKNLSNHKIRKFFEKKSDPYYYGVLIDSSEIAFLAIHTNKDTVHQNVFSKMQKLILNKYESYGAQCFIMVSMKFRDFYRIPWSVWKNMQKDLEYECINREHLKPYRLKVTCHGIMILEGIKCTNNIRDALYQKKQRTDKDQI